MNMLCCDVCVAYIYMQANTYGVGVAMYACAGVAFFGVVLTYFFVEDRRGKGMASSSSSSSSASGGGGGGAGYS